MNTAGFEVMKYDNDFLIEKEYPHRIMNAKSKWTCNEVVVDGQTCVKLRKGYDEAKQKAIYHRVMKKILVATQWIENPNNYKYVKTIDGSNDYRVDNLMWYKPKSGPKGPRQHGPSCIKL